MRPSRSTRPDDNAIPSRKRTALGVRKGGDDKENPNDKKPAKRLASAAPSAPAARAEPAKRSGLSVREGNHNEPRQRPVLVKKELDAIVKSSADLFAPAPAVEASGVVSMDTESMELSQRPEGVEDIDARDRDDPQQVTAYVDEIFSFFRAKELMDRPNANYMTELQTEVNEKMRGILVDWLASVCVKFGLLSETLFLSVFILDRFLSLKKVSRLKLQLVGLTSLLIAAKYEEIFSPLIEDLEWISADNCQRADILRVEKIIVTTLDFNLTTPSPLHFLRRFSKAARTDSETHTLSKFLIELSLPSVEFLHFRPSMIAASAVWLARKAKNEGAWDATLVHYTGYQEAELLPCARKLNAILAEDDKGIYKATKQKYAEPTFYSVSKTPALPLF